MWFANIANQYTMAPDGILFRNQEMTLTAEKSIASTPWGRPLCLPVVGAPSFLECVAAVAAELRNGVDADLIDIAYWSRVSQGSVSRFENHHSQPRELDRLLLAYAKVCDVPPAEILLEAVRRWEAAGGGEIPVSRPDPPNGPTLDAILEEEADQLDEQREQTAAKSKRKSQRRRAS